jgi:lipopolysaccharide cholinephosphotransferase
MKIRKKNTYIKEVNKLLPNRCTDCDGIFIDVFIYDYMAKSTIMDLPLRLCNSILMPIIIFFENMKINPVPLKHVYRFNAKLYGFFNKGSKYIGDDLTWTYRNPMTPLRYRKEKMFPTVRVPFEDTEFPVPNDAKEYLIRHWGEKCLTPLPVEKRKPGHVYDINLTSSKPEE